MAKCGRQGFKASPCRNKKCGQMELKEHFNVLNKKKDTMLCMMDGPG